MNTKRTILSATLRATVATLLVVAITACQLATLPDGSAVTAAGDPSLGPVAELPDDQIGDVSRGGVFAFESYVSVALEIDIELVAATELAGTELAETEIIATVTNPSGDVLVRASAVEGAVNAAFGVTTATPYVTLTLAGVGVHERSVVIEEPAQYTSISRTMALSQLSAVASRAQGLIDSDGDGIPDIYDAYPDDPTIAFETSFPGDGAEFFTVAFEDNFPNLGDGDYNDFVVDYEVRVSEFRNSVLRIEGSATARAKVAGYDHEFGLMLRMPGFSGVLLTTLNGETVLNAEPIENELRIPLFPSTTEATQNGDTPATATFQVDVVGTPTFSMDDFPAAPFDPYLFIKNTGYDVHLIGESPLPGSRIDPSEDFRDAAGFPRALLVPGAFAPPKEVTSILDAYPRFGVWVENEGAPEEDGTPTSDWYLYPNESLVMQIFAQ